MSAPPPYFAPTFDRTYTYIGSRRLTLRSAATVAAAPAVSCVCSCTSQSSLLHSKSSAGHSRKRASASLRVALGQRRRAATERDHRLVVRLRRRVLGQLHQLRGGLVRVGPLPSRASATARSISVRRRTGSVARFELLGLSRSCVALPSSSSASFALPESSRAAARYASAAA